MHILDLSYLQLLLSWLVEWTCCLRSRLLFFHVMFLKYVFNDIFGQRLFAIVLNLATPTNCFLGFPSLLTLPSQSTLIKLIWCLEHCLNQFYIPGLITLGSKHPKIGLGPIKGFIPPPC